MSDIRKKICLVASAGGHLTQLLRMIDSWKQYEAVYVSTSKVVIGELSELGKTYIIGECDREHFFRQLKVFARALKVVLKERPDYVLSTGAAPGFMMCLAGKLFGAKIIWVDSIANVRKLSLSGRLARPLTDLFLTQWPELADSQNGIDYYGGVL